EQSLMQVAAAQTLARPARKLAGVSLSCVLLLTALIFAQHEAAAQTAAASPAQTSRRKVITNRDLEAVRRKRLAEEAEYERKRAAEGLPSQEELRKQAEERDRRFIELAARIEATRVAEEYESLRRELSLLRSQLNVLGAQSAASTYLDASPPVYYAFPLVVPGRHSRQFFRHGARGRLTHGRFHSPLVSPPFQHGFPGGLRGHRPNGGLSLHLRFGSTPRAATRGGHGRGHSSRR
ncbi:MAG TPA: hypothetical protein VGV59_10720, partial [Pyrinomonadaceae bacterium]|nr:hypothetical protein [Pyrinomonadaceae bacterium]